MRSANNDYYASRARVDGAPTAAWALGLAQLLGIESDLLELTPPEGARLVVGEFNNEAANAEDTVS